MLKGNYRQGIRILEASLAIVSNQKSLLLSFPLPVAVESLLTDFKDVKKTPFPADPDGRIIVQEIPGVKPFYKLRGKTAIFGGPFTRLDRQASDPRYSLWGNQGFLYRFGLYLLEKKHRLWSLHACALFDRKKYRLYVIAGGAGSGKTVFLLSGLEKGLELFSTETVHFTLARSQVIWFMGSLIDNVRLENLRHHFPRFLPHSVASKPNLSWLGKVAVNLSSYRCREEKLTDPETVILLPHVEAGRRSFQLIPLPSPARAAHALFANITEKLAETTLLYDCLPVPGLDSTDLAAARLKAVEKLVRSKKTHLIASVFSSPEQGWGDWLSR